MYTRCPSCGAEISFEPPANRESLPADYKHRIRCPICGVTIGVKLNKPIFAQTTYPVFANQPAVQTAFEPALPAPATKPAPQVQRQRQPVVTTTKQPAQNSKAKAKDKSLSEKKSGVGRNVLMMIFSLVFVALTVVGYLLNNGTIKELPESFAWLAPVSIADGIAPIEAMIKDFTTFKQVFAADIRLGIVLIVPSVLFLFACINFIVALISAIGKKYGRVYNLIISMLFCGLALTIFFEPFMLLEGVKVIDYFKGLIESQNYLLYAIAGWGILQLIFALIFLKSLNRKKAKNKRA